jgi:DNA-binding MarR family transcriptional regulator
MRPLEELIDIILTSNEQIEDEIKQNSDLKNLTVKQLHCIEWIYKLKNPTLSELTSRLRITKPSTSVMLDRLDEHGFISKVKSDNDRRSAHVHLTDKGEKAALLHSRVHKQFAEQLTKKLTGSEKEILIVLLNKAVQSLKK